jgi:hypothetical protein
MFGRLPSPALHPGLVGIPGSSAAAQGSSQRALDLSTNLYFGPASLTWTGAFSGTSVSAPVFRYLEPTAAQQQQYIGSIGAAGDASVNTRGTVAQLPREPVYVVEASGAGVPAGSDPRAVATAFLSSHGLLPTWQGQVIVQTAGAQTRVLFQRTLELPGGGAPYLIDWTGERYGVEVDITSGHLVATGPLPLSLDVTSYPLISNDLAVNAALKSSPASTAAIRPVPTVKLDTVELVYALAVSGNQGFYEPAYLFSGTFTYSGQTYVKRVLVPLVDPSLRSS